MSDGELTLELLSKMIESIKPCTPPYCEVCKQHADYLMGYCFFCEGCIRSGKAETYLQETGHDKHIEKMLNILRSIASE